MQHSIRYLKTSDDVQLAWASMGRGRRFVKAANWLTHLQYDLEIGGSLDRVDACQVDGVGTATVAKSVHALDDAGSSDARAVCKQQIVS